MKLKRIPMTKSYVDVQLKTKACVKKQYYSRREKMFLQVIHAEIMSHVL